MPDIKRFFYSTYQQDHCQTDLTQSDLFSTGQCCSVYG